MKITVQKQLNGSFMPMYNSDCDKAKKYKVGDSLEISMRKPRNPLHHKKLFAIINMCLQNMPDYMHQKYATSDSILDELKLQCGYYEMRVTLTGKRFYVPKSISFEKMDQTEFEKFYDKSLDIVLRYFLRGLTRKQVEEHLIDFF